MNQLVKQWVRPEIQALQAYPVPDARGFIKLDAMENPYGWDDALRQQWTDCIRDVAFNRYPDPEAKALQLALRKAMAIPENMPVMLGNGSDEIIQIIAMALSGADRVIMAPEPGFVMYKMIADFVGMKFHGVSLSEDFSLNMPAMLAAIQSQQPAVIFLAYPNNPTGNLFARADVEQIIKAAPGLVVVDEAYHAFADDSFMGDLGKYPNLVVMRTVSKMGLAGLRLGLLAGPADWLNEFNKIRLPYNINVLTQLSGEFALQHQQVFDAQTAAIRTERVRLLDAMCAVPGLQVFPSQANFVLFRTPEGAANTVFESLKQDKILIKNLGKQSGLLRDCLRVTVGTPEENDLFLASLTKTVSALV